MKGKRAHLKDSGSQNRKEEMAQFFERHNLTKLTEEETDI